MEIFYLYLLLHLLDRLFLELLQILQREEQRNNQMQMSEEAITSIHYQDLQSLQKKQ